MKKKREGFKFKSIKTKILLGVTALILIICLLLLLLTATMTKKAFYAQIEDDINVVTSQASQMIESELVQTEQMVLNLTNTYALTKDMTRVERAQLFEKIAKEQGFIEFLFAKPNGDGENLNMAGATFNLSDREYFQKSIAGEVFTSDILVDLVTMEKIIAVSAPYYENGKITGIIAGIKNIDFISDMCSNFKWGESGILSVYDSDSSIVGHTNREIVQSELNILEKAKTDKDFAELKDFFENSIQKKESGTGEYYFNGNDKVAGFYNNAKRNLTVISSINKSELYRGINRLTVLIILIIAGVVVLSGVYVYFMIANVIAKVFTNLKKDLETLSNYNLAEESVCDYSGRADEVGSIYKSSLSLKENLAELVRRIRDSATDLAEASSSLSEKCENGSRIASDIAGGVDEIAGSASSQAEDTQTGVMRIQQVSELIEKNKENIERLSNSSDRADNLKDEGLDTMKLLLSSTKDNQDISNGIKDAMNQTKNSVDEIREAGEMIKSIADQTNLLALNAAIEAARAGDAGRGFAVVAEEIRKLAENSASFTEQINNSVSELLSRTMYAVEKIDQSSEIVEEQSQNVQNVEEKFVGIAKSINELRECLNDIMASNEELSFAQNDLYQIMENASALSEENAASTEEIAASIQTQSESFDDIASKSQSLSELSGSLNELINKFVL